MSAAQIEQPPSAEKFALIRRFLRVSGIQGKIDSGALLDRFGVPGGKLYSDLVAARPDITYSEALAGPPEALCRAYAPHRETWQDEYESHVNWEFTEEELREVVTFLEGKAGQHFMEARPRMDAYISTNTEALVAQIVDEARVELTRPGS